jgi:hypothetical protein
MLKTDPVLSAPTFGSGRWVEVDAYPPRKIILPQIDGLRGVAICAVIFQHAFSHGISHALVAFGVIGFPYLVDNGWMGVSLFFILSVFVLSLPYTGAETKFYDLAEAFASEGHEVTYLTRKQWDESDRPEIPGVRVIAISGGDQL